MKTKALFSSALAALCLAAGSHNAYAQSLALTNDVPKTVSYQGILTDNYGTPLPDGVYRITLSLYADPTGSLKIWQDSYDATLSKGIFNLYLGAGNTPLPDPATMNTPLWVGTQIGDSPQMYPLTPLSASPYALNVPDRAITTGKLADGAVTADKVSMDYVAGIQINDQQIAGAGTVLKLKGSNAIRLDYDATTNSVTIGAGNNVQAGTSGDAEKEAAVQDAIIGTTNWLGRTAGGLLPAFLTPYGNYNTLAGGASNTIGSESEYSAVVGGLSNDIAASANYNFIGGGERNYIDAFWSVIAGGDSNTVIGASSAISGGSGNIISGNNSTIAGGGAWNTPNTIEGNFSFIGAGAGNTIEFSGENTIGSGSYNRIHEGVDQSMIGAGVDNQIHDNTENSFIGSGLENQIMSDVSGNAIGSGEFNTIESSYNFIGSGASNEIHEDADYSAIVGGRSNDIAAPQAFIGGGSMNEIETYGSTIGGGIDNSITGPVYTASYSTIGGGIRNSIQTTNYGTVGGGNDNTVLKDHGTIAGGDQNVTNSPYGTIGGGSLNYTGATYATVGGGYSNRAVGNMSTLPGGDHLESTGYAQTAVGFYNAPRGSLTTQPTTAALAAINDPLFMVGNGTSPGPFSTPARSNAFEVSYNGHSVVYDVNGQTSVVGGRSPIKGATYVDNILYAWGDVTSGGTLYSDFGVVSITHTAFTGVYDVRIDVRDPVTGAPVILTRGSVTATLTELDESTPCAFIHASRIGAYAPNQFRVRIRDASCQPLDAHFMFKVTGRP